MTRTIPREILLCLGWPALASVSLAIAVGRGEPDPQGILLLACSTASAYGLDRWLDHRPDESAAFRKGFLFAVAVCVLSGGLLAITSWWRFRICVALGLISAAYVPLKRHIPKNLLTATAWTTGACTLPFAEAPGMHPAYGTTVFSVFAIMVCNTVLCDLPDVQDDRAHGVKGITPRYGAMAGGALIVVFSLLALLSSVHNGNIPLGVTSLPFIPFAIVLAKDPSRRSIPRWGDHVVTWIPGTLALILD